MLGFLFPVFTSPIEELEHFEQTTDRLFSPNASELSEEDSALALRHVMRSMIRIERKLNDMSKITDAVGVVTIKLSSLIQAVGAVTTLLQSEDGASQSDVDAVNGIGTQADQALASLKAQFPAAFPDTNVLVITASDANGSLATGATVAVGDEVTFNAVVNDAQGAALATQPAITLTDGQGNPVTAGTAIPLPSAGELTINASATDDEGKALTASFTLTIQ